LRPDGKYSLHCVQEGQQCLAWKQLLTFEKGNPQRLDAVGLSKHVAFTYEQCLMYLYHYPDIWYDYATWHAQNGSPDSAAVVFQRALKALPGNASSLYLVVLHSGEDPACKKYCQFCCREFLQHLQCVFGTISAPRA
jgi:hypothetical protein